MRKWFNGKLKNMQGKALIILPRIHGPTISFHILYMYKGYSPPRFLEIPLFHNLPYLQVNLRKIDIGRSFFMYMGYIESVGQWHELPVDASSSDNEYLLILITFA